MRRKAPVTLNLPERVKQIATTYAEANGRSLSSLIEDLLRRHLEENGVKVNLPPAEFEKVLFDKFKTKLDRRKVKRASSADDAI